MSDKELVRVYKEIVDAQGQAIESLLGVIEAQNKTIASLL